MRHMLIKDFGSSLAFLVVAALLFLIFKKVVDATTKYHDDAECEAGNTACALGRAGLFIALMLGMGGVLMRPYAGFWTSLQDFVIDAVVAGVTLLVARKVADMFILRKVCNGAHIQNNNIAVGLAEAGLYVAVGLILNGAFSGAGGTYWSGAVWGLIGLASLAVLYLVHDRFFTKYDVDRELMNGNVACGIEVAGIFLAFGIVLRASIAGDFSGWATDLTWFGISLVFMTVLLYIARLFADWLVLPTSRLEEQIVQHQSTAAAVIVSGVLVAFATIVSLIV